MSQDRFLGPDEAEVLLNVSLTADSAWDILTASADNDLTGMIDRLFADDGTVRVTTVTSGCDTLIACSRIKPDILVLDSDLNDVPSETILSCIHRHSEFGAMRVLAAGNTEEPLKLTGDDWYDKREHDIAVLARKIRNLFDTPDETVKRGQFGRRWPRTKVNIDAAVELFADHDPDTVLTGNATVADISREGALLSNMVLDGELHPDTRYRVKLHVDHPPLEDLSAESMIVRITSKDTAGIKFVDISKSDRHRITDLFDD